MSGLAQNTRIISFEDVDKGITEVSNLIATIIFDQRTANTSSFVRSTLMNENIEDSAFERILAPQTCLVSAVLVIN